MARPKPEIEKDRISLRIDPDLKRDIQSLAGVYEMPFTVYIEDVLKKHVDARQEMITEKKEANRKIIERQTARENNRQVV